MYQSYQGKEAFFLGYKPVIMKTDTMRPLINKYDVVIVKKAKFSDVKEKNVVYFKSSDHSKSLEKTVRKTSEGFRLKQESKPKETLQVLTDKNLIGIGVFSIMTSFIFRQPVIFALGLGWLIVLCYFLKKGVIKYARKTKGKMGKFKESRHNEFEIKDI